MKCANPMCSRAVGLACHRLGWSDRRLLCSSKCRADLQTDIRQARRLAWRRAAARWLVELLVPAPRPDARPQPARVRLRMRAR